MDIELIIGKVKQLSDEEIAVILDRLDDEKAQLGSECLEFCNMNNSDAAYDCMKQYQRISELRDFVRTLCPLKVPEKASLCIPAGASLCIPAGASVSKKPISDRQLKGIDGAPIFRPVKKAWELYEQGERRV